jgi:hypothetical protein
MVGEAVISPETADGLALSGQELQCGMGRDGVAEPLQFAVDAALG